MIRTGKISGMPLNIGLCIVDVSQLLFCRRGGELCSASQQNSQIMNGIGAA